MVAEAGIRLWDRRWNMEQVMTEETCRDGLRMSVGTLKESPVGAARETTDAEEAEKARCLCGKWWAYRSGDSLILRCKLCRRDIVVSGENLKITYR